MTRCHYCDSDQIPARPIQGSYMQRPVYWRWDLGREVYFCSEACKAQPLEANGLGYWSRMVRGYTAGATPELVLQVAQAMLADRAPGGPQETCIWHEVARAGGYLDRCPCSKCRVQS